MDPLHENFTATKATDYVELVRALTEEQFERTGRVPSAFVRTYGCQQNVSDGEKLSGMLSEMGYSLCSGAEDADVVLYNTCAIRENAENRIFGNVGALRQRKTCNPDMVIGLCGCMMQQQHIADKIRQTFPFVDIVFGTHALPRLPELLYRKLTGERRVFETEQSDGVIVEDLPVRRDGAVKAWLPIMYGCDNFCTYCVVPLVRGRERSRSPERVLAEARELVGTGYRDITLLGQNVNSYSGEGVGFAELLRRISAINGDFRIRFMTSHPKDCTRELLDVIAENPKICSHIHLPVQSGSNRILAAMNRKYTREQYLELIRYAREKMPGVTFTSDIIVGFPGEEEKDFAQTLSLVEEVGYQSLFTFLYSKRTGTKAAELPDPTPREVKLARFNRLLDTQLEIGLKQYRELVGQTIRVLADTPGKLGEHYLAGRSESNVIVEFEGPGELVGSFVEVTVTRALKWCVVGEVR